MSEQDYKSIVKDAVLDEAAFARMTLSKKFRADGEPWAKIVIRPVEVKGKRAVQFSYFDAKRDVTKNYRGDELEARLDEALAMPFGHISVSSRTGDLSIRISRTGKVQIARGKPSVTEPDLSHDRTKSQPLPAGESSPFLGAIGVTDERGEVRPSMQAKYRQINEFVKIVEQVAPKGLPRSKTIRVVDCGCGSAYLTFAAHHYLTETRGLKVETTGVDVNAELIEKNRALAESLGWKGLEFVESRIADYNPAEPPEMVLSLHACDTATDEAISRGVAWRSRVILAAPCCQHELNDQLASEVFRPVIRHGILKERLADILTDAFRALALRIMGYRVSVIEFVSPEATSKNLMIRAEAGADAGTRPAAREYVALRDYWGVTPAIERLLGEDFANRL